MGAGGAGNVRGSTSRKAWSSSVKCAATRRRGRRKESGWLLREKRESERGRESGSKRVSASESESKNDSERKNESESESEREAHIVVIRKRMKCRGREGGGHGRED